MSGEGREELRERLANTLHEAIAQVRECYESDDHEAVECWDLADALLPTVCAIVADELRAAARIVERSPGIKFHGAAVRDLRVRADALCGLRTGAEGETGVPVTPRDGSGAYRAIEGEV